MAESTKLTGAPPSSILDFLDSIHGTPLSSERGSGGLLEDATSPEAVKFLEVSRDTNPDQEAKNRNVATQLGTTAEAVQADPEGAANTLYVDETSSVLRNSPTTDNFLQDPQNAQVAHDAVKELSFVEGLFNGLHRGWLGIQQSYHQNRMEDEFEGIRDSRMDYSDILRSVVEQDSPWRVGPEGVAAGPVDHLKALQRYASSRIFDPDRRAHLAHSRRISELSEERSLLQMTEPAQRFTKGVEEAEGFLNKIAAAGSDPIGLMAFASEVGIEFLPQLFAASAVTLGTRNPQLGALTLGAASAATERYRSPEEFLRAAGIDLSDPSSLDTLLQTPEIMQQAQEFGLTRASIIGTFDALSGGIAGKALADNPIFDFMLQTSVQAIMGGTGEATAQLATTGEVDMNEVIFEAVGELATTPIEIVGVGGRPIVSRIKDATDAARAKATTEGLNEIHNALQESPLTERAPEAAAQHMANVFENGGVDSMLIPAEAIRAVEGLDLEALGVADQMPLAEQFGGDVRINAKELSQYILQVPEVFNQLKDHIRADEASYTAAEAAEVDEETTAALERAQAAIGAETEGEVTLTTDELVSRDAPQSVDPEINRSMDIAEHEAGVAALFQDAKEAGFTEKQYASYIEAIQNTRQQSLIRAERAKLNREKKRLEKEYQQARADFLPGVEETVSQSPIYNALNGIGVDRLDYEGVLEIFNGDARAMERLPKQNGRRIYTPKSQKGLDPQQYADIYGFPGADVMLFSMVDAPTFEQAVEAELTRQVEEQVPTLLDARGQIDEALDALHAGDQHGTMLTFELARLRQMRGQKRIRPGLIRTQARKMLDSHRVGRINATTLEMQQRREGRRAVKALRAGDLEKAARHKYHQALAFYMTKEAYKVQKELERGNKMMRKIQRTKDKKRGKQTGLPVEFREKAQEVLSAFDFGSQRPNSRRLQQAIDRPLIAKTPGEDIRAWRKRMEEAQGIVMELGPTVQNADGTTHWKNLTLEQWRSLRNDVREIERAGREANKIRRENEKAGVDEIVSEISQNIEKNLKKRGPPVSRDTSGEVVDVPKMESSIDLAADTFDKYRVNLGTMILNATSLLRGIDGFQEQGAAFRYIKGGIDRAYTDGYMPNQVGYVKRMNAESKKLVALYDMFSKRDRNRMWRQQDIPGVRRRLSHGEQVSVLLNMGNAENIAALTAAGSDGSPQFTEMELQAIVNNASKRDLDFVQGVWDFLKEFEPELKETVRRRQNRNPTMVEAQELQTQHGTYRGGYFPLKYDNEIGILDRKDHTKDLEETRSFMLRGGFTASHTQDGHTKTREGSGGRPVKLDPFVIQHHMNQLIYDLEMGDALHDSYKVLHNPAMKRAFENQGAVNTWRALDLWLGDTITGEVHRGDMVEKALRHIRTGTTISKLAFNVTTAALQPLGVMQSMVLIGKGNMIRGITELVKPSPTGKTPRQTYKWVEEQSGFMAERERNYNKDIHDAQHGLVNGFMARKLGRKTLDAVADYSFLFMAKMQRIVDMATWLGARHQGTQLFPGDEARATAHADLMVERAQGSGIFHQRTNFERGTINPAIRNTEVVRAFSLFLSYFAAKMNVAWERTKKADFRRNPMEIINYPVDIAMLFAIEGMLAAVIKEGWPEGDDEEVLMSLGVTAVDESWKTFLTGVPIAREFVSASQGFATGGSIGGFATSASRVKDQISQGEVDAALVKSVNNLLGILFKYPTSQVNKTGQAIYEDTQHNDVKWWEYATGIRHEQTKR